MKRFRFLLDHGNRWKRPQSRDVAPRFRLTLSQRHAATLCLGDRFWGRGCFSTTNGAIREGIVLQDLENHIADPAGTSRQSFC